MMEALLKYADRIAEWPIGSVGFIQYDPPVQVEVVRYTHEGLTLWDEHTTPRLVYWETMCTYTGVPLTKTEEVV